MLLGLFRRMLEEAQNKSRLIPGNDYCTLK